MMPSIPNSFFIAKEMKAYIENKVIRDFTYEDLDIGKYYVFNISEEKTSQFKGQKIMKADSNFIVTDNGWLCEFGYSDGALRYYTNGDDCNNEHTNSLISGGVSLRLVFDDASVLRINLSGWSNRLDLRPVEPQVMAYPFRNKFPLDAGDKYDFTFENYKSWLASNGKTSILEAMVLAKGATDIRTSLMNYILWQSKVNPKRKVNTLNDDELHIIYNTTVNLINEYLEDKRTCFYTDILGIKHGEDDESLTLFTSATWADPALNVALH